jgi:hypothetical protein
MANKRGRKEEESSSYDSEVVESDEEAEEEEEEGEDDEENEYLREPTPDPDDLVVLAKKNSFVTINDATHECTPVSPWRDCALLVLCIFQFRKGPWNNCLNRDVRTKIAKFVYEQPPFLAHVSYYTGVDFFRYTYETNHWEYGRFFRIYGCSVCRRPADNTRCWLHGRIEFGPNSHDMPLPTLREGERESSSSSSSSLQRSAASESDWSD